MDNKIGFSKQEFIDVWGQAGYIEDFYSWDGSGNYSETSHWAEYFVEYSGLGGQIVINWSNL